jgi:hypothetical protein
MKNLLLAALAIAGGIVGATQMSAAASSPAPASPLISVQVPTGPELPPERVLEIAQAEALRAGDADPSTSLGNGTLAQAMRAIDPSTTFPEAPTSNETGIQIRKILSEPVVLVVMEGSFTLSNAHVRPGAGEPTGSILDLVIDSHSGAVVGRALPIRQEVPVQGSRAVVGGARGRIAVRSVVGTIRGRLLVGGGPARLSNLRGASHWRVVVSRSRRIVARLVTDGSGGFAARVPAGHYTVSGRLPAGTPCGTPQATRYVLVRAGMRTDTHLTCSIR